MTTYPIQWYDRVCTDDIVVQNAMVIRITDVHRLRVLAPFLGDKKILLPPDTIKKLTLEEATKIVILTSGNNTIAHALDDVFHIPFEALFINGFRVKYFLEHSQRIHVENQREWLPSLLTLSKKTHYMPWATLHQKFPHITEKIFRQELMNWINSPWPDIENVPYLLSKVSNKQIPMVYWKYQKELHGKKENADIKASYHIWRDLITHKNESLYNHLEMTSHLFSSHTMTMKAWCHICQKKNDIITEELLLT